MDYKYRTINVHIRLVNRIMLTMIYKLVKTKNFVSLNVLNVDFVIFLIDWLSVCLILVYVTCFFVQRRQRRKKDVSAAAAF